MSEKKSFEWHVSDFRLLDRVQLDFVKMDTFDPVTYEPWGTIIGFREDRILVFHGTPEQDFIVPVQASRIIALRRENQFVAIRPCKTCGVNTLHTIVYQDCDQRKWPWRICGLCRLESTYGLEKTGPVWAKK